MSAPAKFRLVPPYDDGELEIVMQCQAVWAARRAIRSALAAAAVADNVSPATALVAALDAFELAFEGCHAAKAPRATAAVRAAHGSALPVLRWYNSTVRLRASSLHADGSAWPNAALLRRLLPPTPSVVGDNADRKQQGVGVDAWLLPPPTPCDTVPEANGWGAFGTLGGDPTQWVGHGLWWRDAADLPEGARLDNAAGNAMHDVDCVESRFSRLTQARVLCLDYSMLRRDFPCLAMASDAAIDAWAIAHGAWLAEGQVKRLAPGGDHHALLGIDQRPGGLAAVVDVAGDTTVALRLKSGGRAATFFPTGSYTIDAAGTCQAAMLDVKGIGTHIAADTSAPNVTGLLCLADALREWANQRLVHRLLDLEGSGGGTAEGSVSGSGRCSTVGIYGILDTGLQYVGRNPATGWAGDRCVLLLRQRQSRFQPCHDAMSFAGNAGGTETSVGCLAAARRALHLHGVSAEFEPAELTARLDDAAVPAADDGRPWLAQCPATLDAVVASAAAASSWNLQCDASGTALVDMSDFFVLPTASRRVPAAWRMSREAVRRATALGPQRLAARLFASPVARRFYFAEAATAEAFGSVCAEMRQALFHDPAIQQAAATSSCSTTLPALCPRFCMSWLMELDDSAVAQRGQAAARAPDAVTAVRAFFADLEALLPTMDTDGVCESE